MKIVVVVLNYNGWEVTRDCLDSLQKLKRNDFQVDLLVVDNGSTDDSVKKLRLAYPEVNFLLNQYNLGFSEGNNVGVRWALKNGADFVLLLNNDTTISPDLISILYEAALKQKIGGIFCPKIYFAPGFETHPERYKSSELGKVIWYAGGQIDWENMLASHRGVDEVDKGQYDVMIKTAYATGCCMLIRREVWETVGYFDKKFYMYYEDLDLSIRASRKGYGIYYVPQAYLWHKNAVSAGGAGSETQIYYITRNRMLIGMRYAPWRTKLALYREALNLLMRGNRTQKKAIGDFLRKKYGPQSTTHWQFPQMPKLPSLKMPQIPKVQEFPKNLRLPKLPQMPNFLRRKKVEKK